MLKHLVFTGVMAESPAGLLPPLRGMTRTYIGHLEYLVSRKDESQVGEKKKRRRKKKKYRKRKRAVHDESLAASETIA